MKYMFSKHKYSGISLPNYGIYFKGAMTAKHPWNLSLAQTQDKFF